MTWATRDPRTYPARFPLRHREACASTPLPVIFGVYSSQSQAESEAFLLRKYRYLIRSHPSADFSLTNLLSAYDFRTKIEVNPFGDSTLLLLAKPNPLRELLELNPQFADIYATTCQ
jgi:hypothetical protein